MATTAPLTAGLAVRATPLLFVFIWASGFIVAKYAAGYADSLTFLLRRSAFVVVLMALLAWARWPSWRQAGHLAVTGIGLQVVYPGGVWMAVSHGMPASVVALIVNLQPVLTALVGWMAGESMGLRRGNGLILGFLRVTLVVTAKLTTSGLDLLTVTLAVAALFGITAGTLYQKRFCPEFDLRTGQVMQFTAAIVVMLPVAAATESFHVEWTPQVVGRWPGRCWG
ncbi:DMT family transporter [Pseudonocardia alaniniphila]|uniref:DMT family transporter n=1 Tax=Pseudonocardia alaniniphila TaxID=75291 RepID=A0ABS9TG52_9PSEU|nr:DMT family transporter [Pseudonocardia alaniniphila]MCH6167525.1 DMT family transporter [Pseudonocardia alaniniphila]